MAKIITKAVTRLQKFLAAIAGDGVAPNPITDKEKLLFNIAEEMKAASASDLPDIGSSDKNKFLHTNESTGALEWAEGGGSGGGVLVVTEANRKLSESFNTINAALKSGQMVQLIKSNEVSGIIYAANVVSDGMNIVYDVTGMDFNGRAVWESDDPNTASLTRL